MKDVYINKCVPILKIMFLLNISVDLEKVIMHGILLLMAQQGQFFVFQGKLFGAFLTDLFKAFGSLPD